MSRSWRGADAAELHGIPAGGGNSMAEGSGVPASLSRRGQSPTSTAVGGRRNATGSDNCFVSSGKAGNSNSSDCPERQQYAVRAAELPKVKGVFIGKKHTCWVAQWNDANGLSRCTLQPRSFCQHLLASCHQGLHGCCHALIFSGTSIARVRTEDTNTILFAL